MIKRESFRKQKYLIVKKERAFENLNRSFDIMIWIKIFDAFDDTNENEEYERKCGKKRMNILENDLNNKKNSISRQFCSNKE